MTQYLLSNITPTGRTLEPEQLQQVVENVTEVTRVVRATAGAPGFCGRGAAARSGRRGPCG